ncbi:MAG: hypothetical protein D6819_07200, partial [Gammaproteobacteria bacterium]
PDVVEKCRRRKKDPKFRAMLSERMRQPETRDKLSRNAKLQWSDLAYKTYMKRQWRKFYEENASYREANRRMLDKNQREYWSQESNRQAQAKRVKRFFAEHPKAREYLSEKAKNQWKDSQLLAWRREKTKGQWTPEFRTKRKRALNRTYYLKTIEALKTVSLKEGTLDIDAYQAYRLARRDNTLLRFDTFCQRYFGGDEAKARQAVENYNHRIVSVERLQERIDVYDLEVPGTHNFALASGVFVHNSAKQGRDRRYQAILPLKGKILNVEKARFDKMLSSAEVATLITALGCGIGKDDYNPDKLRYHRIIIATDADVDGAHIRTLLLTFFYRQMPDLVERGHIYIAQPPLYRLKKGKQVRYVKDDAELEQVLLESALAGARLEVGEEVIKGRELKKLSNQFLAVRRTIARLSRRYSEEVLKAMLEVPPLNAEDIENLPGAWVEALEARLRRRDAATYTLKLYPNSGAWQIRVDILRHGVTLTQWIEKAFFATPEYRQIAALAETLQELFGGEVKVVRGEKEKPVESFEEAMGWLMGEARRGLVIQRYKGLGEMNPEQLWETTMDPEKRRLLQVRVEDAVAADALFTTLMGDHVEPRREFIETHALSVVNLDI